MAPRRTLIHKEEIINACCKDSGKRNDQGCRGTDTCSRKRLLAGYYFFVASTNPELKTKGLTAFVTKTDVEGLSVGKIENKMGIRPAQVSEMIFKDVIVPVENRLGKEGEGFKITILQYLEGT